MAAMATEDRRQIEERIDLRGRSLRQHAARGTIINSAFQVGLAGVGFLRRIIIAAFLTREEFGIWGILVTTLMTLAWLKEIGVSDKYVQQSESDQKSAFQKAFTIEFLLSLGFFALVAAALPVYAVAYGRSDIIVPGLVLALSVPISAFESPVWIAWRRMQFVRQRVLASIDPLTTAVVTIVLGAAGAGYWSLIAGTLAGSVIGATAAVVSCPYPIRLRFDRATTRDYASFSWPLFGYQLSNLAITQGMLLVAARAVGVAAVGAIALASAIAAFADRVDTIVSETIYPAVCAVADRMDLLFESFIKSNRLAMMWGMPFGVGLALFAPDLVHFVLGDQWKPAIGLLAAFGVMAGLKQVAFNWQVFMRAVGRTRPIFWSAIVNVVSFAAIIVPMVLAFGLTGYAAGNAIALVIQIGARTYFLRGLFPRFRVVRQFARAVAPTLPAVGAVLLVRLAAGPERSLAAAVVVLVLYVLVTAVATWAFERSLVTEILGYLRGSGGIRTRAEASQASPAAVPEVPSGV
jgi:O-antigen/teichoic acid export membrane protein